MALNDNIVRRFWKYVDRGAPDACWLWTGGTAGNGYGVLATTSKGPKVYAHRLSYEIHYGPIPDGMFACHTCDAPACVNPAHLWAGSASDNVRDMYAKGRNGGGQLTGEACPSAVLTEEQVRAIRSVYTGRHGQQKELASQYGISPSIICRILKRQIWTHID